MLGKDAASNIVASFSNIIIPTRDVSLPWWICRQYKEYQSSISVTVIASCSHTSTQLSHPIHFSWSTFNCCIALPLRFIYRPRNPRSSAHYRCVEDHCERFEQAYEERFEKLCGFFRPYLKKVIYRYLDCGDPHNGFARVKCKNCGHEYLLAFSCKRRHFCPSCHQKRVMEFGDWPCEGVLKALPHCHFTFSIPKILRRYFLYERRPLSELSRYAWDSLNGFS